MASDLLHAVARLDLDSTAQNLDHDDNLDDRLSQQRPRKRVKQDPEILKKQLEESFLHPSYVLSE